MLTNAYLFDRVTWSLSPLFRSRFQSCERPPGRHRLLRPARPPGEHFEHVERPEAFRELAALAKSYAAGLDPRPPIHQDTGRLLPLDPLRPVPAVELSDEETAALRELGYVD